MLKKIPERIIPPPHPHKFALDTKLSYMLFPHTTLCFPLCTEPLQPHSLLLQIGSVKWAICCSCDVVFPLLMSYCYVTVIRAPNSHILWPTTGNLNWLHTGTFQTQILWRLTCRSRQHSGLLMMQMTQPWATNGKSKIWKCNRLINSNYACNYVSINVKAAKIMMIS